MEQPLVTPGDTDEQGVGAKAVRAVQGLLRISLRCVLKSENPKL